MSFKQATVHISAQASNRQIYHIIGSLCLVMIVLYVYFISAITFHVVARRGLETALKATNSHVGQLQLTYTSLAKQYDLSYATANGFVSVGHVAYVDRSPIPVALLTHGVE